MNVDGTKVPGASANDTFERLVYTACVNLQRAAASNLLFDHDRFDNLGGNGHQAGCPDEGRIQFSEGEAQSTGRPSPTRTSAGQGSGTCSDGVQLEGDGVRVGPGNEFTGMAQSDCSDGAHSDPIQIVGASNEIITGNWFHDNGDGSGGCMCHDFNPDHVTITNNVFASTGYAYSIPAATGADTGSSATTSSSRRVKIGTTTLRTAPERDARQRLRSTGPEEPSTSGSRESELTTTTSTPASREPATSAAADVRLGPLIWQLATTCSPRARPATTLPATARASESPTKPPTCRRIARRSLSVRMTSALPLASRTLTASSSAADSNERTDNEHFEAERDHAAGSRPPIARYANRTVQRAQEHVRGGLPLRFSGFVPGRRDDQVGLNRAVDVDFGRPRFLAGGLRTRSCPTASRRA